MYIIYILYNNRFELFITNLDEIKSKGWNMENSKNGNLICSNGVCELVCDTGYNKSNGICCENEKYNSNGKCCPINTVNVKGNCMSRADADTKFQRDISQFIDIQYHKTDAELMEEAEPTDVQFGNTVIYDENGNTISYPSSSVQGDITYYTPGAYPFGTANYVPNYADSIYLSKLTGQSTTTPVYNTSKMLSGFCSYFEDQPQKKEEVCNKLDPNTCASTNCCVLLGGSKCVSGNTSGPSYKRNYGDVFLRNKDYYYYQGKCYGNCQ
jgi:hypothetical protein